MTFLTGLIHSVLSLSWNSPTHHPDAQWKFSDSRKGKITPGICEEFPNKTHTHTHTREKPKSWLGKTSKPYPQEFSNPLWWQKKKKKKKPERAIPAHWGLLQWGLALTTNGRTINTFLIHVSKGNKECRDLEGGQPERPCDRTLWDQSFRDIGRMELKGNLERVWRKRDQTQEPPANVDDTPLPATWKWYRCAS